MEGVSCPNKWFLFEQNCYGFFETKLSWNDAETECTSHNKNTHLASILSEREMETISSVLLYYEEPFSVWIGLFKNKRGKTIKHGMTSFVRPNSPICARCLCTECSWKHLEGCIEAISCPSGWFMFQDKCYGFHSVPQSWKDA
ncbi:putative C-type lectin protein, partial [Naja naja]